MPRQHGAWAMLYAPAVLVFAGFGRFPLTAGLALSVAMTAAFFAVHAGTLLARGRAVRGWFVGELVLTAAAGGWLVLGEGLTALWVLAAPVGAFGAVYLRWVAVPGRKHRTLPAELVTIAMLTLSAPAAAVVARGALDAAALGLWLACFAFFGGGVFHVRALALAGRPSNRSRPREVRALAAPSAVWHAALGVIVVLFAVQDASSRGLWVLVAYGPVVVRGLLTAATLAPHTRSLRSVGVAELGFTVVFVVAGALALRGGAL